MRRKGPSGPILLMQSCCISQRYGTHTVEKPEVHPHAKNFQPQVCATKPQQGMSPARGSRQARLPGQKCVKKDSKHTPHVLYIYQHVMLTMQCNADVLFTDLQGYKILFDESFVHTLSIPMEKLICFYKNMQSDMFSLCLQKHFIQKGHSFFQWVWRCTGNFVYNKSLKINAVLLIIFFVICRLFLRRKKKFN